MIIIILTLPSKGQLISKEHLGVFKDLFMSSFWTLFWDDITIFWGENLLLFTFLTSKLGKTLCLTKMKFVFLL